VDFSDIIEIGIDLTKFKRFILMEPEFLIRNELQSIGRVRRCNMPKKIKQVFVYRLETNMPIEKKILERRKLRKNCIMKTMEAQWAEIKKKLNEEIYIVNNDDSDVEIKRA
jgi:SNF2 family DNA or RNA helicase